MPSQQELRVIISGDSSQLNRAFARAGTGAKQLEDKVGRASAGIGNAMKTAATVGTAAFGVGLVGVLKESVDAFMDAEKVAAQTAATLKSTGGVANVTAAQIGDLATAISKKSGLDDEAVQSAENMLLTFTNVRNEVGKGNDIFNQATQTVADFSVTFKKDLAGSAVLVGKALNDPIKGTSALSKVGVQFTKDQKAAIEQLVKSGDLMGAQKLILKELAVQTEGAAEAYGNTLAGKVDKAKVAFGNLTENIGGLVAPALADLATKASDVALAFGESDLPERFFKGFKDRAGDARDAVSGLLDSIGEKRAGGMSLGASIGDSIADGVEGINWGSIGRTLSKGISGAVQISGDVTRQVQDGVGAALGRVDGRALLSGLFRVISEAINALFSPSFWTENFANIFATVTIAIPFAKILKIPGAGWLYNFISRPILGAIGRLSGTLFNAFSRGGSRAVTGFLVEIERVAPRTARALLAVVTASPRALGRLPGRMREAASRASGAFTQRLGQLAGDAGALAGRAVVAIVRGFLSLGGRLSGALNRGLIAGGRRIIGWIPQFLSLGGRLAAALGNGIVRGVRSVPGRIAGALGGIVGGVTSGFGLFDKKGEGIGKTIGRRAVPSVSAGSLQGASSALSPLAAVGAGYGLSVSSGKAGRETKKTSSGNTSYHSTGEALDLAGSPAAMMRTFRTLKSRFGSRLAELIYTPGGAGIKNGRSFTYGGKVAADHYDHVHVAVDLGRPGPGIGDGPGRDALTRTYPQHRLGAAGAARLSPLQVRAAAEMGGFSAGLAVQMTQIARGESDYYPGVVSNDGGYGLWQMTPRVWGPIAKRKMNQLGGLGAMMNPVKNAKMAKFLYDDAGGFGPWYGTKFLDRGLNTSKVKSVLGKSFATSAGTSSSPKKIQTGNALKKTGPGTTSRVSGYDQTIADVEADFAAAEYMKNTAGQVNALNDKKDAIRARLKKVTAALRRKGLSKATRLRLTQERAQLLGDLGQVSSSISELLAPSAEAAGGDPNQPLIDAMEALKESQDAAREAAEEAAELERERMAVLQALLDEQKLSNSLAQSTLGVGLREAQRVLADLLSGELGGRFGARSVLPAGDVLASY